MPMPEGSQLNQGYNPILTNIAVNYIPKLTQFIAKQVFPNVPVGAPSGIYNVWLNDDFYRPVMKRLSNYEAAPIGGFGTAKLNYNVQKYGVATNYTAQDLAEARRGGTQEGALIQSKNRWVTMQGVLQLEIMTAAIIQTAANWTTTAAGVASNPVGAQFIQWNAAASQPVDDVIAYVEQMRLATGFEPNTMIIPIQVFNALRKNQQLMSRILYGGTMVDPTQITIQMIKDLFAIDNILVPKGVYNSAPEGEAKNLQYIWGKSVWLGYVAASPSVDEPSAGYHFSWAGDTTVGLPGGIAGGTGPNAFDSVESPEGLYIRQYRQNRPSANFIESELWTTPNVVAQDLGMVLTAVIP